MGSSKKKKQVASPISTGGGGTDFERYVGAYYLGLMLLQAVPRGRDSGILREVRFQRLYAGEPLDDLIILAQLPNSDAKLALQIKRDITFGEKDTKFDEVIKACWETFQSPRFIRGMDKLGIVVGLYSKTIDEHYQSVLSWARNSANAADFFTRLEQEHLASKTYGSFVSLIRAKIDSHTNESVGDHELWQFLRSMTILHFDFLNDGSRDKAYIIEMLKSLLSSDKLHGELDLFKTLIGYAAEMNRTAGSIDYQTLLQKLHNDGIPVRPSADCRNDLERLQEHAGFILGDIRNDIAGLVLNRTEIVLNVREQMENFSLIEIIGPPGAGKSAVLKAVIESKQNEGPVLLLSGNRLAGKGWNGVSRDLQITHPLRELLIAVSANSTPCLFIDGLDKVIDPGTQTAVNDLLRTIAETSYNSNGTRYWTVVYSAREDSLQELYSWLDLRTYGKPQRILVPELNQDEINIITNHLPHLKLLLLTQQLNPINRNPFMLSLLEDQRMLGSLGVSQQILTERRLGINAYP